MIEFLPEENHTLLYEAVSNILSEKVLTEWLKSLMSNDQVFDQVAGTAGVERLRQLYRFWMLSNVGFWQILMRKAVVDRSPVS